MADNNTENLQNLDKLFTAVDTIIQKRIENLPYDKTITATIVDDSTATEGRYIVDDGTTTFDAYTENENYHNNEQVYVNIPQGDYNKQRLIMGKYIPNDGNKYVYKYVSPMNSFIDITGNLIDVTETSQWGLIANKTTDRTCYYKRIWAGEVDLQGYDVLGFSGRFRTWLPEYKDLVSGEYGIQIDILGSRPTTEGENQEFYYTFYFSNKDMYGDPYNFDAFYLQEKTFDISGISKIDAIAIGLYQDADFRTENSFIPVAESDNIFVSNPMLAIGYSSDRFKTDEAIIYTDNPLTYLSQPNAAVKRTNPDINFDDAAAAQTALDEANKRLLQLRWIHLITEEEEGVYNLSATGISTSKAICIDKPEELPESAAIKWYKYNKPKVDEKQTKTYSAAAGEFWDDISFTNSDLGMVVIPDSKEPKEEYKAIVEYPSEEYVKEQTEIELNKTDGLYDERRALFNFTNEQLSKLYYKQSVDNIEAFIAAQSALIAAYKDVNDVSKTEEERATAQTHFNTLLGDFVNTYQYSEADSIFIAQNQSQVLDELFERYNLDNKQNDDNFAGLVLILYDFIQNPTAHLYLNNVLESISYIKENISFDTDEELNKQIEQVILPQSLLILHLQTLRLFLPSTVSSFFSNIWTAANGVQVGVGSYATAFGNALKDFNDAYAAGTLISSAPTEEAAILTEAQTIITKLQDLDTEISRYRSTELGKVNYYTSNIITFENEDPDAELNKVKELLAELRIDIDVDGYQGTYNCYGETGEILNENENQVSRLLEAKIVKGETITDAVGPDDFVTWEFPLINSMIERPVDVLEYVIYETATDATTENFKNGDYYYLNEEKQYIHIVPTDEVEFQTTPNYYYKKNNVSIDDSSPDVFSITRKGDSKQYFRIKQMYSSNYTNNAIKCYVKKADGSEFTAVVNLSFGEKGNSGTDYTFYLEFEDKTKFALQATGFTEDEIAENKHKIKIVPRLFNYNGREITNEISRFDFTKNCDPSNEITMTNYEGKYVEIYSNKAGTEEWNPANFANTIIEATCSIEMTLPQEEGFLQIEEIPESEASGNVKHTLVNKPITGKEVSITLSTALPIPVIKDNKTVIAFDGSSSISYSSSGTDPLYYKDQFTLYSQNKNRIEYTPNQHWKIYNIDGEETDLYYPTIDAERRLTVPGMYLMDGENVSLFANVDRPGEEKDSVITTTEFILPLRVFMRVYDSKLLNSWDGSLTLDSQNGIILSALMGAGYKDDNNTFNGVLMGSTGIAYNTSEDDSYYSGLGLYGYSQGQKSFGFNINGRAFLGKMGRGQILFDGNNGIIKSSLYDSGFGGTSIDLTSGLIEILGIKKRDNTQSKIQINPNPDEENDEAYFSIYSALNKSLVYVGNNVYYLKSANYNGSNTISGNILNNGTQGTYIDLKNGYFNSTSGGKIGCWSFNSNQMYDDSDYSGYTGVNKYGSGMAFWAGGTDLDGNNAPFHVSHSGVLTSQNNGEQAYLRWGTYPGSGGIDYYYYLYGTRTKKAVLTNGSLSFSENWTDCQWYDGPSNGQTTSNRAITITLAPFYEATDGTPWYSWNGFKAVPYLNISSSVKNNGFFWCTNRAAFSSHVEVDGNIECWGNLRLPNKAADDDSNMDVHLNEDGWVYTTKNSSSKRFKNNIKILNQDYVSQLYDIPVYTFKYNDDWFNDKKDERFGKTLPGFISEDWDNILPESVTHDKKGLPLMWNYQVIVPLMFQMIKNDHKKIESLEQKIAQLEKLINEKFN